VSNPEQRTRVGDMKVDTTNLYREETFSDLRVASIRRLSPVKADGSPDETRTPIFVGETTVMTNAGPVPIEAPIDANTLEEAMEKFPAVIQQAIERMISEVRRLQRQQASRIIVPETGPGGKIHLG